MFNLEGESMFILKGYHWFGFFKRLMVDLTFYPEMLIYSQDRYSEVSPKDAFKLVAIELSFLYDTLYTKAVIIHCISGRVVRCCSLISIVAAFIVFHYLDKTKFKPTDITITYILLATGLGLEVVAAVLLVISDWTIVSLSKSQRFKCLENSIVWIVNRIFRNGKPRWSRTIRQYNLVAFCLRSKNTLIGRIMSVVKVKHAWDNMCATKMIPLPDLMEVMMYNEAKRRALNVDSYKVLLDARSYRGRKALERHGQLKNLEWSMKREFDECIILWHVATDICYYKDTFESDQRDVSWKTSNYMVYLLILQPSMTQFGFGKTRFEVTCAVVKKKFKGKGKLKGKDACEVLIKKDEGAAPVLEHNDAQEPADGRQPTDKKDTFVLKKIWAYLRSWGRRKREEDKRKRKDEGAAPVLGQNDAQEPADGVAPVPEQNSAQEPADGRQPTDQKDTYVLKKIWAYLRCWGRRKGEENKRKDEEDKMGKLVLKEGLRLAKELQEIKPDIKRWQLISETWMEMMGYAAIHCNSYEHAKSLSRGGELLTHFWLLMAHMGVVDEHKIQQYEHKIQPSHSEFV